MDKTYFKCRDDSYYTEYTKEEIFKSMDIKQADFISKVKKYLKDMDYPYFEEVFKNQININIEKNIQPERALGRYINVMRLRAYKSFGSNDGE